MTEQLRAALTTYGARTAFRVLAASILPMLLVSYRMALAELPDRPAFGFLVLAGPAALFFFIYLGHHLKVQFASFRPKLFTGFLPAHLAAALLLIFVFAGLTGAFTFTYAKAVSGIAGSAALPETGFLFGVLWMIMLLSFSAGYFFSPGAFWGLLLMLMISIGNSFLTKVVSGRGQPASSFAILLVDAAWTLMLVKRLFRLNESMFEYRNKDQSIESQRYWWTKYSEGSRFQRLFEAKRSYAYLEQIKEPLPHTFLHHVRHFEESSANARQALVSTTILLVLVLWAVNLMTGGKTPSDPTGLVPVFALLPAMSVFSGTTPILKRSLQSIFMLPLERTQIVSRYGCALFVVLLKNWLPYAAAGLILSWMPSPGRIEHIPSALPLLSSTAAQLPVFGIFSLAIGRSRGVFIGLAILAAGAWAFAAFFSAWLLPVTVLSGVLLIGLSYRHWCHAEIID